MTIKIDSRRSSYPYSKQCRGCANLESERLQKCKVYDLDIKDEYWLTTQKCPNFRAK